MPKASPRLVSFNSGEFSPLLRARLDIAKYASSYREGVNFIPTVQGPLMRRPGTRLIVPIDDEAKNSRLIPFTFSAAQNRILELGDNTLRVLESEGLQTYTDDIEVETIEILASSVVYTVTAHGLAIGDVIVPVSAPAKYGIQNEPQRITAVTTDTFTTGFTSVLGVKPAEVTADVTLRQVYVATTPFLHTELEGLRYLQTKDVMYFFSGKQPQKLKRNAALDWEFEPVTFLDGPYLDPIYNADMRIGTNVFITDPEYGTATAVSSAPGSVPSDAFDGNRDSYWQSGAKQEGELVFTFSDPTAVSGYVIYRTFKLNDDPANTSLDLAPSTWDFYGYDGAEWVLLHSVNDYVLYDNGRTAFFSVEAETEFEAVKIVIKEAYTNGALNPTIGELVIYGPATNTVGVTVANIDDINSGAGFLATDVGRAIRIKGAEGNWFAGVIAEVDSTTEITITFEKDKPFEFDRIQEFRLGLWSDSTGWPKDGYFFDDRLWCISGGEVSDYWAGSVVGDYENFTPTSPTGEVLDNLGLVFKLLSQDVPLPLWIRGDERGLLIGSARSEWTVQGATAGEAITAKNIQARSPTRRGSADVPVIKIDRQILFVVRGGRTLAELAYVYEVDGIRIASMSTLASHLVASGIKYLTYAAEPHNIVWVVCNDGSLAGFTYNRAEDAVAWHKHDLGGSVLSAEVIPAPDQLQDELWLVVQREINGVTRRYVEVLTSYWDFGYEIEDSWFVDCGLKYDGVPTRLVGNLHQLEGLEVYGLADNKPFGPKTVTDGVLDLGIGYDSSVILVGLGIEAQVETNALDAGSALGTSQGAKQTVFEIFVDVWDTPVGLVGVPVDNVEEVEFAELFSDDLPFSETPELRLRTELAGPIVPAKVQNRVLTLVIKQTKDRPYNLVINGIYPKVQAND